MMSPSSATDTPFLFDGNPLQDERCHARVWQSEDKSQPVFLQCRQQRKQGPFCTTHSKKLQDPAFLGIWDPPSHASVPPHKLEEARKHAQKRAGRLVEEVTAVPAPAREMDRGRRELSRVQRAGFGVESSASADPPRGSDEASTVDVGPSAPAMDEGRRVQGAVPADTQRKRFGDLTARRAEHEYVDE